MSYSPDLFAWFMNDTISYFIKKYLMLNKMIALIDVDFDYLRQSSIFLN